MLACLPTQRWWTYFTVFEHVMATNVKLPILFLVVIGHFNTELEIKIHKLQKMNYLVINIKINDKTNNLVLLYCSVVQYLSYKTTLSLLIIILFYTSFHKRIHLQIIQPFLFFALQFGMLWKPLMLSSEYTFRFYI